MTNKTYNGWTNYATWRVNLEIFDGGDWKDHFGLGLDPDNLKLALKELVENLIYESGSKDSLAVDYALAFLSDVNWHEIAEHLLEDEETQADIEE